MNHQTEVARSKEMYETYHDVIYNEFRDRVKDRRKLTFEEYDEIFHDIYDKIPHYMTYIINSVIMNHGWMVCYEQKGEAPKDSAQVRDITWYYELVNESRI